MSYEEGTNFPRVLGRKTYPRQVVRTTGIADQPIALIRGETPMHLAQRFRQAPGGGSQLPAFNVPGLESHLPQVVARPVSRLRMLRGQTMQATRSMTANFPRLQKLRGQIGYIGPGGRDGKNVPTPYSPPPYWSPRRAVSNIPAVTGIVEGPGKTLHPQMHLSVEL